MAIKSKLGDLNGQSRSADRFRQVIPLISGGYSAPQVFKDGKLTVLPWDLRVNSWLMTTRESANLTGIELTRRLLAKLTGLSLDNLDYLPTSEVNLVLMVARSSCWPNNTIVYTAKCPHCGHTHLDNKIKVPDELGKKGVKPPGYPGYDVITLPECGDELKLRPLLIGDSVAIETRSDLDRKMVSDREAELARSIIEVNNGKPETRDELLHYLNVIAPGDLEYAAQQLTEIAPRLDEDVPHVCDSDKCRKHFTYSLNLNIDFFRRRGTDKVEGSVAPAV